jgi:hypothetical protein
MAYYTTLSINTFNNIPNTIPFIGLWLDGMDPNNNGLAIQSSVPFSKWVDKSGNNNDAISIGKPGITDGVVTVETNNYFTTPYVFNNEITCFFVGTIISTSGVRSNMWTTLNSAKNACMNGGFQYYPYNNNMVMSQCNIRTPYSGTLTINSNTRYIFSITVSNEQRGIAGYINGIPDGTFTDKSIFPIPIGGGGSEIGKGPSMNINEIICYNGVLSVPERQKIEGYLSKKWKIVLPGAHPFYTSPPIPISTLSLSNSGRMQITNNFIPIIGTAICGKLTFVYGQDGNMTRIIDSNGNSRYYIGSPNDFSTLYYSSLPPTTPYTYTMLSNPGGTFSGAHVNGTLNILGVVLINNLQVYYVYDDGGVNNRNTKMVDENKHRSFYAGLPNLINIVWYYIANKNSDNNGSYVYTPPIIAAIKTIKVMTNEALLKLIFCFIPTIRKAAIVPIKEVIIQGNMTSAGFVAPAAAR